MVAGGGGGCSFVRPTALHDCPSLPAV